MAEEAAAHPDLPVEVFATDEHRLGLKPVTRRVWAPVGERPVADGHHRFEWLYVTAFVSPATGETFWYLTDGVSKPMFEAVLALFAREAGAGRARRLVLALDQAGWHGQAGLAVPAGVRLVFQPASTRPNCSRPRRCGRWSTSRSSTATSPISPPSTPSSPTAAPRWRRNRTSSADAPASTGGRRSQIRSDQPETV